jgi:5-methylcytosine-specific restriction endonuclease McrA
MRYYKSTKDYANKVKEFECITCGKIVVNKNVGEMCRRYCSDRCSKKNLRRIGKQKRKALLQGLRNDLNATQWAFTLKYFNYSCAYCGEPSETLHQDHFIPLSKKGPYSVFNILPSCPACNIDKSDKDFLSWYSDYYLASSTNLKRIVDFFEVVDLCYY